MCCATGRTTLYKIDRTLINLSSDSISVEGTGIKQSEVISAKDTFSYYISFLAYYMTGSGILGILGLDYFGDTIRILKPSLDSASMFVSCKTMMIPFDTLKYASWEPLPEHEGEYVLYSDTIRILDSMLSTCGDTIIIHE
jgi:hypothetical protein